MDSFILLLKRIRSDSSISAIVAGLIAVTVGFAGPVLLIFQAAKVINLSNANLSSWIWAISIASGLTSIILSIRFKAPVITAWSTPGAVMLISGWSAYAYSDSIGAFIFAGILITVLGFTGLFSSFMKRIPYAIITAMLAGILLKFGVDVFVSSKQLPMLALPMILSYLVSKRWFPRYAVVTSLFLGLLISYSLKIVNFEGVSVFLVDPIFTKPTFSLSSLIGLGIPLCIVTMASQNATGIGVLRADGYNTPVNPLIITTGIASILFAPFGAHGINMSALIAAICTGKEAHLDPDKRYIAGISAGFFYLIFGIFGATIVSVFAIFPSELIVVITGLALFGSIGSSLTSAMQEEAKKEAALITFLVTLSGISIAGVGSPFWGLIAGIVTDFMLSGDLSKLFSAKTNIHLREKNRRVG
ncbi:benzoate/H(+) symporter BenE family transporter [Desulfosporosinus fructosivorans]